MKKRTPLKRHPKLVPLSREHHKVLILAQLLKMDVPDYKGLPNTPEGKRDYLLHHFDTLLQVHIQKEEQILIPTIMGKEEELDQLTEEILVEHQEIKRQIENLRQRQGPPQEEDLDVLGKLLEQHVRKEERQWFARIQMVLSEEELEELSF